MLGLLRLERDLASVRLGQDGERFVATVRLRLVLIVLLSPGISLFLDPRALENQIGMSAGLISVGLAIVARFLAARESPPLWLPFATSNLDIFLVTAVSIGFALAGRPIIATNSFSHFPLYLIVVFATCLRYDRRVTALACVSAVCQHLGLALVLSRELSGQQSAQYGYFSWETQLTRAVVIILSGVLAVALVQRNQGIWAAANEDGLTGLRSRRFFEGYVQHRMLELARTREPAALVVIDLDHFKKINDTFGHAKGDAVLRLTGKLIVDHFRDYDMRARLGGEEFVILMTGIEACAAARRVRAFLDLLSENSQVGTQVTASAGISFFPEDATSVQLLLEVADERLYRAKAEGRDRAISTDPTVTNSTPVLNPAHG